MEETSCTPVFAAGAGAGGGVPTETGGSGRVRERPADEGTTEHGGSQPPGGHAAYSGPHSAVGVLVLRTVAARHV